MWYRGLGFKLICTVSAIAILVIGGYATVNLSTQRNQLIHQVIQSTSLVSDTIKRSMRYDMLKYQPERLHRAIDTIGGQEGIEKARISNYLGEIIYSSDRKEMSAMVNKSSEQELKASEEKHRSLFDNDPNPIFVFDRSTFQIILTHFAAHISALDFLHS